MMGPMGLSYILPKTGLDLQKFQSGYLYHYTFIILGATTLFLVFEHIIIFDSIFVSLKSFYSCYNHEILIILFIALFFVKFLK